jgi:hypothetical protein
MALEPKAYLSAQLMPRVIPPNAPYAVVVFHLSYLTHTLARYIHGAVVLAATMRGVQTGENVSNWDMEGEV